MILTLHSSEGTYRVEISADEFLKLRNNHLEPKRIDAIASSHGMSRNVLLDYARTLTLSGTMFEEPEGSCDYTDHTI